MSRQAPHPILSLRNLSVTLPSPGWRKRTALSILRDCALDCREGEIHGLIGASGAGKSLLALAILGLLPRGAVVSGERLYRGQALDERTLPSLRGRAIAYLPQGVQALDPAARSDKQVLWSAHRAGFRNGTAASLAKQAMATQGIALADQPLFPHELSGGMARRVLGAAATVGGADLVLADEPTTGLDPQAREQSLGALRRLADQGRAVLVISHDLSALSAHADQLTVMRAGETLESLSAEQFAAGAARHSYARELWAALPENGLQGRQAGPMDVVD